MGLTRDLSFDDFVKKFIGIGFIIAVILTIIGGIIGAICLDSSDDPSNKEILFSALRGEKVEGKYALDVARMLKKGYSRHHFSAKELITIGKMDDANHDLFLDEAKDNIKEVNLILKKSPRAPKKMILKKPDWGIFWEKVFQWGLLAILLGINLGYFFSSVFYEHISDYNSDRQLRQGSCLLYPWKQKWAFVTAPIMFPYLAISQPILLIRLVVSRIDGTAAEIEENEARRKKGLPDLTSRKLIKSKKRELEGVVQAILGRGEEVRETWIDFNFKKIAEEKGILETETYETEDRISHIKSRIDSYREEISSLGNELTATQRELAATKRKLRLVNEAIESTGSSQREEFGIDYDKLIELPIIKAIDIVNGRINVYTNAICVVHNDSHRYRIGEYFLIEIDTIGREIKVVNLCSISTYSSHHPHSTGDGGFCFGNNHSFIYGLLEKREYFALIIALLQSIQKASSHAGYWKEEDDASE